MQRREFLSGILLAGAAWPREAHAEATPLPLIGYIGGAYANASAKRMAVLRQGLAETGYTVGRNVAIEYRWGENRPERLLVFAQDLVRRGAKVIIADSTVVNAAVRAVVGQVPVVFLSGADPVKLGWVQSLNRPGGTQTGVVMLNTELTQKRSELLIEAAPGLKALGLLGNAANTNIAVHRREMETTARAHRLELQIYASRSEVEFEAAFRRVAESHPAGMVIQADPWLDSRADQIIALAAKYETPSIFQWREQTEAGGLLSYGVDLRVVYRTIGNLVGRILGGMPPSNLPVQQATKIELIVNLRTARTLRLKVAESVLVRADDLIE